MLRWLFGKTAAKMGNVDRYLRKFNSEELIWMNNSALRLLGSAHEIGNIQSMIEVATYIHVAMLAATGEIHDNEATRVGTRSRVRVQIANQYRKLGQSDDYLRLRNLFDTFF